MKTDYPPNYYTEQGVISNVKIINYPDWKLYEVTYTTEFLDGLILKALFSTSQLIDGKPPRVGDQVDVLKKGTGSIVSASIVYVHRYWEDYQKALEDCINEIKDYLAEYGTFDCEWEEGQVAYGRVDGSKSLKVIHLQCLDGVFSAKMEDNSWSYMVEWKHSIREYLFLIRDRDE